MSRSSRWSFSKTGTAFCIILLCTATGYAIDEPNVLVVYNQASADGVRIAQAYQDIYPSVRLLGLDLGGATGEEISAQTYLNTVRPAILQALNSTTDVIVTTKGMPLRINNPYQTGLGVSQANWAAYSSLESELTRIDTVNTVKAMGWQSALIAANPAVANPYDLRNNVRPEQPFSYATFGIRLSSRLDGFTADDVIGSLRRASYAPLDLSSQSFVLDDDPNAPRAGSDKIPAVKSLLDARGYSGSYTFDSTTSFLTGASGPVLGYVSHGTYGGGAPASPPDTPSYVLSQLAFTPANGAFFSSYESFNAYSFNAGANRTGAAGPQALLAEWIAKGGSAAVGAVEEPKAGTTAEEDQIVKMLLDGYSWAEAAWSATWQLSYVNTVVGDPLMRWVANPKPGDANMDGDVNMADFSRAKVDFGREGQLWRQGDFNADGVVNLADFSLLKCNWSAPPPQAPLAVPEPASLAGLAIGAAALARRRRR